MIFLLEWLEVIYTVIWLVTSAWCFKLGTKDSVAAGVFLSAIYWGFWQYEIFVSPEETLSFHFLLLIALLFSSKSLFWRIFFGVIALMAVADSIWLFMPELQPHLMRYIPEMPHRFPYAVFWWQSLLIILFLILCGHTLIMNYYTHSLDKLERALKYGNFWAYWGIFVEFTKSHIGGKLDGHTENKINR